MKRPSQDVAGRPKAIDEKPEVAGGSISPNARRVASVCHDLHDPLSADSADEGLIDDFADFLAGDADGEDGEAGRLPPPDPEFRERLRRRLWKHYVTLQLRSIGKETH